MSIKCNEMKSEPYYNSPTGAIRKFVLASYGDRNLSIAIHDGYTIKLTTSSLSPNETVKISRTQYEMLIHVAHEVGWHTDGESDFEVIPIIGKL